MSPASETPGTEQVTGSDIDRFVARYGLYLALLAAWTATLGSLFFSEVLHWVPCVLCWYQRIAMYPLAILLAVGLLAGDRGLPRYSITLSVIGGILAIYHWLYQHTTWFDTVRVCTAGVSCKGDYLGRGVVTIPFLALVAFLLILLSSLAVARRGGPVDVSRPGLAVGLTIAASIGVMLLVMLALPPARFQWLGA